MKKIIVVICLFAVSMTYANDSELAAYAARAAAAEQAASDAADDARVAADAAKRAAEMAISKASEPTVVVVAAMARASVAFAAYQKPESYSPITALKCAVADVQDATTAARDAVMAARRAPSGDIDDSAFADAIVVADSAVSALESAATNAEKAAEATKVADEAERALERAERDASLFSSRRDDDDGIYPSVKNVYQNAIDAGFSREFARERAKRAYNKAHRNALAVKESNKSLISAHAATRTYAVRERVESAARANRSADVAAEKFAASHAAFGPLPADYSAVVAKYASDADAAVKRAEDAAKIAAESKRAAEFAAKLVSERAAINASPDAFDSILKIKAAAELAASSASKYSSIALKHAREAARDAKTASYASYYIEFVTDPSASSASVKARNSLSDIVAPYYVQLITASDFNFIESCNCLGNFSVLSDHSARSSSFQCRNIRHTGILSVNRIGEFSRRECRYLYSDFNYC